MRGKVSRRHLLSAFVGAVRAGQRPSERRRPQGCSSLGRVTDLEKLDSSTDHLRQDLITCSACGREIGPRSALRRLSRTISQGQPELCSECLIREEIRRDLIIGMGSH